MAPIYFVNALGYECPPEFATLKAARVAMKEFIKEDICGTKLKLCKIRKSADHYELKIGNRQGFHTYSEYWISKA